jgi:hypothetical protein
MSATAKIVVRDTAILAATLGLWAWNGQLAGQGTILPIAVALLAGVMTTVCGFLAHEWGHLIGAWLAKARVEVAGNAHSLFLFRFDTRNTREQFLWMSMGGFIVSGLVIALLVSLLDPRKLADGTALGLTLLGVIATIILEFPPAWRVYRGGPIPTGAVYISEK